VGPTTSNDRVMGSELPPVAPTYFPSPADFRAWLKKNHHRESVLWVGYYKKATGRPSVTWEETVDEALCYGWIDGIRRPSGDESYVVRFTPRKPTSVWSRRNIERVEALKVGGRMRKAGLDAYAHKDVHPDSGYAVGDRPKALPKEMIAEFKNQPEAWAFYESQPSGYQKQTTAWVTSAKREDTRQRRLATLIDDSANGLRIKQLRRE
jgi:uncharacterized protein YdeI (YjbR/CyaY-like superfamily)